VTCSGGLLVVQRGHETPRSGLALRVNDTRPVPLPTFPPVEARTADGEVWRRHWLEPHRLVISFVGIASVEIDERTGGVVFDRAVAPDMEQHLLFDHVLPLVLARRGRLVLHGALISRSGAGVVLVGAGGAGKSTLTAFAWQQGWTVGGDDGVVVAAGSPPSAEPTYPTIRLSPASAELLGLRTVESSSVVGKLRVDGGDRPFRQSSAELRAIALIEPIEAGRPATFERLDGMSAHARLFGSTFHADLGGRLLPSVVDQLALLVERTAVGVLTVPRGIDGLGAAERVLRTLVPA